MTYSILALNGPADHLSSVRSLNTRQAFAIVSGFSVGTTLLASNKIISYAKEKSTLVNDFSIYAKTRDRNFLDYDPHHQIKRERVEGFYKRVLNEQDKLRNILKNPKNGIRKTISHGRWMKEVEITPRRLEAVNQIRMVRQARHDFVSSIGDIVWRDIENRKTRTPFNITEIATPFDRISLNPAESLRQKEFFKAGKMFHTFTRKGLGNFINYNTHTNDFLMLDSSKLQVDLKQLSGGQLYGRTHKPSMVKLAISYGEKSHGLPPIMYTDTLKLLSTVQKTAHFENKFGNSVKYIAKAYNLIKPARKILPWVGATVILGTAAYIGYEKLKDK